MQSSGIAALCQPVFQDHPDVAGISELEAIVKSQCFEKC